ncbi:MAG: hypothetical protein LH491_00540 [Pseudoxanthomonas sp.]|nr:hypothetical protein [Pseudoxanthomonas sp.]
MPARKDFTQTAFDVFRQATGEQPKAVPPAPKPQKETAPKAIKGAAKKANRKTAAR